MMKYCKSNAFLDLENKLVVKLINRNNFIFIPTVFYIFLPIDVFPSTVFKAYQWGKVMETLFLHYFKHVWHLISSYLLANI